jgi:glutamate N-acetyltransferase/amino-acid N-acetyltransferase
MCAAGYSGAEFDPSCVDVYLGTIQVARDGRGLAFDEAQAVAAMQQENVVITLDLKAGEHSAIAWGCDLSYDYVRINADYRS